MENSILYEIEQDGIKKGMKKGMKKGIKKVAKNLKDLGFDEKSIQEVTELTIEEINQL